MLDEQFKHFNKLFKCDTLKIFLKYDIYNIYKYTIGYFIVVGRLFIFFKFNQKLHV